MINYNKMYEFEDVIHYYVYYPHGQGGGNDFHK